MRSSRARFTCPRNEVSFPATTQPHVRNSSSCCMLCKWVDSTFDGRGTKAGFYGFIIRAPCMRGAAHEQILRAVRRLLVSVRHQAVEEAEGNEALRIVLRRLLVLMPPPPPLLPLFLPCKDNAGAEVIECNSCIPEFLTSRLGEFLNSRIPEFLLNSFPPELLPS